jgi:ribosome assembly protein RRB1
MDVIPAQEDEEGQQVTEAELEAYLKTAKGLEADEHLVPDNSVYLALHQLQYNWPCLSFDILRDGLGWERAKFPHTAYVVAGTQAGEVPGQGKAKDEVVVMRWGSLSRTQKDDLDEEDDEDEDDDDDGDDDDAVLDYLTIPHVGSVNRIRAQPQAPSPALLPPSSDPYHVATFSETGKVHIFDVRPTLDTLASPATSTRTRQNTPVHTITSHGRNEGFALDWAGSSASSNLRLLSGDIASKIYLTTLTPTGFNTGPSPYLSHTSSIEDLQWSPTEPTVFASCSADRSVRVWDVRAKNRKSVVGITDAHKEDVNVISWNKEVGYLMVSGGDEGELKVWDLRNFKG